MNKYQTKVINYSMSTEDDPILGVEVPEGFLRDLDLKVNEILVWEIDPTNKTATISKAGIIVNE